MSSQDQFQINTDRKNQINILNNIALVSPAAASGFGAIVGQAITSGIQLHFPIISGSVVFTSGSTISYSGSGLVFDGSLIIGTVQISGSSLYQSGAVIRTSGSGVEFHAASPVIANAVHISSNINFVLASPTPSNPVSGRVLLYARGIDSTNEGLYTKIRINDLITETLIAPVAPGSATNEVVSGRFSGQQLWLSGATIMSSGSGLAISPAIDIQTIRLSGTMLFISGSTVTSSGSGLLFNTIVKTFEANISGIINMSQISTPSDPVSGRVGIYIKAINGTNDGVFAKIRVQDSIQEVRIY